MSYPLGIPIPYTCLPATPGFQTSDHTVAWLLGDGTTSTDLTFSKTWDTLGDKTAEVTATNTITGGAATASKTITIDAFDWISYNIPSPIQILAPLFAQLDADHILIAGGGSGIKDTYTFDGTTFEKKGDLNYPRTNNYNSNQIIQLAKLADGRLWTVGNNPNDATAASTAEIYDPATGTWSVDTAWGNWIIPTLPDVTPLLNADKAYGCNVIPTPDGGVVILGGMHQDATFNGYCIKYRPGVGLIGWTTILFSHLTSLGINFHYPPCMPCLVPMADGRIFGFSSGQNKNNHNLYDIFIIDPRQATAVTASTEVSPPDIADRVISWQALPDLPGVTDYLPITVTGTCQGQDGDLYVMGVDESADYARTFAWRVASNSWEELPLAPTRMYNVYFFQLADRYLMGTGVSTSGNFGSVIFDIKAKEWIMQRQYAQAPPKNPQAAWYSAFGILDGYPVVLGNPTQTTPPSGSPEFFRGRF